MIEAHPLKARAVLWLSFLILFTLTAFSTAAAETARPAWPHEGSDLAPDPSLTIGKLPNGFRYVLMKNTTPRDRVSMHLNVQAGSFHESDEQQGLAHFLEHLLFCGTTHFKPGELVRYFQEIGMQFGPDANAHTGFTETVYDILLPSGGRRDLEKGLIVLKDYAEGALLLESEINRERNVVLAEKRARDSADYRTFLATLGFRFPDARLPHRLPIGKEEVLRTAGRPSVKDFYDAWYRPETMILVLVGDFDPKTAAELIADGFSGIAPRGNRLPAPDLGEIRHAGLRFFHHYEKETGSTEVSIETTRRITAEKDTADRQKRLLTRMVADRIVQYRLDALLRKPDAPFTSVSVSSGVYLREIDFARISAESNPEKWESTLSALEQTLRTALSYGFTEAELDRVKREIVADLENRVRKGSTRKSQNLAREIIRKMNEETVFQSPEQRLALFGPSIASLTAKEVSEAFAKSWPADHRLVLLTGNTKLSPEPERAAEVLRAAYVKSALAEVNRPPDARQVSFPYFPAFEKPGEILRRNEIQDLGIVQVDFANGVRLNVKKTDFEAGQVIANLSFGTGLPTQPKGRPGLTELARRLVNESGLGAMDTNEIERALAGKKTSVSFHVEEDRLLFKGRTVSDETHLLVELFYAHLTDPGYREEAFALVAERFRQEYKEMPSTVEGAMTLSGKRFLAGGDDRFGMPPYPLFQELNLGHVRSWLDQAISRNSLEISVVGDCDVESVIGSVGRYFGNLPPRPGLEAKKDAGDAPPVFPSGKSLDLRIDTVIPKGLVVVAYPTEDYWDIRRTRGLSVLSEVFSERLRLTIREKLGAAYSPYAYNRSSRAFTGYGLLQALIHIDPEKAEEVAAEVKAIAASLASEGISPEELKRAVEPILTGIRDLRRTNDYWLGSVLTDSVRHPLQLEWSRSMLDAFSAFTPGEISKLAARYLDNEKAATLRILPSGTSSATLTRG